VIEHFKRNMLGIIERALVFLNLKNFIFFGNSILNFITLLTVYNLNDSYFIDKNCSKFQIMKLFNAQRGLIFLNLKNFIFW